MSAHVKHKLEFAQRKRFLRILSAIFGVEDVDHIFLDMMVDPADYQPKAAKFYSSFYRYDMIEAIEERLRKGSIICGFYDRKQPDRVYVSFGHGCNTTDFMAIHSQAENTDDYHHCCGLNFYKMEMQYSTSGVPSLTKEDVLILVDG